MTDEYEEDALEKLADLAAADAVPESIKMLNEAAVQSVARHGLPERFFWNELTRKFDEEFVPCCDTEGS